VVDRPRHHLVAGPLGNRAGLTGEEGLVDGGPALEHHPVGGDLLAGEDPHHVPLAEGVRGHVPDPTRLLPVGDGGKQLGQGLERPPGLADAFHLQPVAEEHHHDQGGELPIERPPGKAQRDRQAVEIGDADRQGDERHHPRPAGAELGEGALEEGGPAVEVEGGAEHRPHPGRPRRGRGEAQPGPHLLGEEDHRQGQKQAQPKPPPEDLGVVARVVPVVPAVPGAARGHRGRRSRMLVFMVPVPVAFRHG